jgi:hypothetical protein
VPRLRDGPPVNAPELLGDLAAVFLARTWHNQPEGAHVTDPTTPEQRLAQELDNERRSYAATQRALNTRIHDLEIALVEARGGGHEATR